MSGQKKINHNSGILVDLDSLLDTRLGLIMQNEPEVGIDLRNNPKYYVRTENSFPTKISWKRFKNWWDNRDETVLEWSPATFFRQELSTIVSKILSESYTTPYRGEVKVIVNTYPYQLDEVFKQDIAAAVAAWIDFIVPVECVYLPMSEITPEWVRRNIDLIIMYDYNEWAKAHESKFVSKPLADITLLSPKIWHIDKRELAKDEGYKEWLQSIGRDIDDDEAIFEFTEMAVHQFIDLNYHEVSHWCVVPPKAAGVLPNEMFPGQYGSVTPSGSPINPETPHQE